MTAAGPDPRFRDQLAEREEFARHFAWAYGGEEYAESGSSREHWLEVADDFLAQPFMRAYVEARVQAAANQRAAEAYRASANRLTIADPQAALNWMADQARIALDEEPYRDWAGALASPAPGPCCGWLPCSSPGSSAP